MEETTQKPKRPSRIGYKFVASDLKSIHGDLPPWQIGVEQRIEKGTKVQMCNNGFHWSPTPMDAFSYIETDFVARIRARGATVWGVDGGRIKNCSAGMIITKVGYVGDLVRDMNRRITVLNNREFHSIETDPNKRMAERKQVFQRP